MVYRVNFMRFQFQTGSIKRFRIMATIWDIIKFQFQTGSIKRFVAKSARSYSDWFQFQTGSIKRKTHSNGLKAEKVVSIPNWFD